MRVHKSEIGLFAEIDNYLFVKFNVKLTDISALATVVTNLIFANLGTIFLQISLKCRKSGGIVRILLAVWIQF